MGMKRKWLWVWIGAALVVIITGIAVRAESRNCRWCRWQGHHAALGPAGYVARELNLTDGQKKQIGTIWDGERPRVAGLIRELASEQAQLRAAIREKNDGKIQEIASQQGASITKLLVEKERTRGEIYGSVLNADQRKKADALEDKISERLTGLAVRLTGGGAHEN